MRAYKNQNTVEQGFRFLKQPVYMGPVYLKTPERIKALGYVFLLVLLVAKYLEHRVRTGLEKRGKTLRRGGQKLPQPTAKTILEYLQPITLIRLGDQSRVGNSGENADAIIEALGFDWSLCTQGDCEDRFIRSKSSSGSTHWLQLSQIFKKVSIY